MPKGQSLYHQHPDYRVDLEPSDEHVRVRFAGEVVADSNRTLVVRETRPSSKGGKGVVTFSADVLKGEDTVVVEGTWVVLFADKRS